MLLSAEAGRQLIWGYSPDRDGAGFELAASRFKFLTPDPKKPQKRRWFRPSDIAIGTDGTIYVSDWVDPFIGGHRVKDKPALGVVYRIKPADAEPKSPEIDLTTTDERIAALKSPAPGVRFAGFQRLRAQGSQALPAVRNLRDSSNRYIRARAVWLMAQLGEDGKEWVRALLRAERPAVRITAFRALQRTGEPMLPHAEKLVNASSPAVRREVALALREVPVKDCRSLLIELAQGYDGEDRWYLEAFGTACEGNIDAILPPLEKTMGAPPLQWSDRFSDIIWRLHPPESVPALRQRATATELSHNKRKQAINTLAFIQSREAATAKEERSVPI